MTSFAFLAPLLLCVKKKITQSPQIRLWWFFGMVKYYFYAVLSGLYAYLSLTQASVRCAHSNLGCQIPTLRVLENIFLGPKGWHLTAQVGVSAANGGLLCELSSSNCIWLEILLQFYRVGWAWKVAATLFFRNLSHTALIHLQSSLFGENPWKCLLHTNLPVS